MRQHEPRGPGAHDADLRPLNAGETMFPPRTPFFRRTLRPFVVSLPARQAGLRRHIAVAQERSWGQVLRCHNAARLRGFASGPRHFRFQLPSFSAMTSRNTAKAPLAAGTPQ
jgi:hypothetical protein